MKNIVLTSFLSILLLNCYSQKDYKSNLIGNWIKTKTETLDGKETDNRFGRSEDYLRISFTNDKILFSRTPYDKGEVIGYKINRKKIMTEMYSVNDLFQESYYIIEKINDDNLVLRTKFNGTEIRYYLKNQKSFLSKPVDNIYYIDNDTLVIIRRPSGAVYYFSNVFARDNYFTLRPLYFGEYDLGLYLGLRLSFQEKLVVNKISKPIKVTFNIDSSGKVSNVQLIEGFTDYYDKQFLKLIAQTNQNWNPMIIDNPKNYVSMTFTFLLLQKDE